MHVSGLMTYILGLGCVSERDARTRGQYACGPGRHGAAISTDPFVISREKRQERTAAWYKKTSGDEAKETMG
jgi:hypothetical protein